MSEAVANVPALHGILAEFSSSDDLLKAVRRARAEGYQAIEAYTPMPCEEIIHELGYKNHVATIVFCGGFTGACVGMGFQYWVSAIAYPLNVGGRPFFSWPSFIPVTFELTILFASLSAVFGMLILNGLPMPNHPLFNVPAFELASRNRFFLVVESSDPRFDVHRTRAFLQELKPLRVEEVPKLMRPIATILAACAALGFAPGCRQDMQDQPRYKTLSECNFFADHRSERPLVAGTVARGRLFADELLNTGKVDGKLAEVFPFAVTQEVLERGHDRYNIFCAPCHDRTGGGNGMIVQRGMKRPASFHIQRLRESPPGYYFDVMTNGFGAMYDLSDRVGVDDRWKIAAYVRALQLSENATLADVPQSEIQKLQEAH